MDDHGNPLFGLLAALVAFGFFGVSVTFIAIGWAAQ